MSNEMPKAELLSRKELSATAQELLGLLQQLVIKYQKLVGPYANIPGMLNVFAYETSRSMELVQFRMGNTLAVLDQQFTEEGVSEATERAVKSGNVIAGDFPKA